MPVLQPRFGKEGCVQQRLLIPLAHGQAKTSGHCHALSFATLVFYGSGLTPVLLPAAGQGQLHGLLQQANVVLLAGARFCCTCLRQRIYAPYIDYFPL